jgi:hypothetical protein
LAKPRLWRYAATLAKSAYAGSTKWLVREADFASQAAVLTASYFSDILLDLGRERDRLCQKFGNNTDTGFLPSIQESRVDYHLSVCL